MSPHSNEEFQGAVERVLTAARAWLRLPVIPGPDERELASAVEAFEALSHDTRHPLAPSMLLGLRAREAVVRNTEDGDERTWLVRRLTNYLGDSSGACPVQFHMLEGTPPRGFVLELCVCHYRGRAIAFDQDGRRLGTFRGPL